MKGKVRLFIIVWLHFSFGISSQARFTEPDTTANNRLLLTASTLGIGYGTSVLLLNNAWYRDFPRSEFHFFDDWSEWEKMDKFGHVFSAQFQSIYTYHLYRWSGISENKSILYASLTSLLFQSTIEVFDGFSSEWGFSVSDCAANVIGVSLFAFQQKQWKEQRILMKLSGTKRNYSDISLKADNGTERFLQNKANDLFGSSWSSRLLKDYNAQTIWLSVNLKSVLQRTKSPEWLNISFGYGAENMFGGFQNSWENNGETVYLSKDVLKRYHQFYIAPDIDLTRIKVKKKGWRTVLSILNIFKFPLPAIEVNTQGKVIFHPVKF